MCVNRDSSLNLSRVINSRSRLSLTIKLMGCCASTSNKPHSARSNTTTMPTHLVLHYFNVKNRAECIRLLLAHKGIKYEDHRIQFPEWNELKSTFEFGTVPVLEYGEKKLSISTAILRYLAQKNSMYPTDQYEIYLSESTMDLMQDCIANFDKFFFAEKNPVDWETWLLHDGMNKLKIIENRLVKNQGGQFYLVGNSLSYVDFIVFAFINSHFYQKGQERRLFSFSTSLPVLKSYVDRIEESSPGIQAYLKNRPITEG